MNVSHPSVHPVEAPPLTTDGGANDALRVRMKDIQGMPGTFGGLALRFSQFVFAVVALGVMATTGDFPSVTAFRYLVAAVSLQSLWSLSLAIVDIYALLVRRCLRNFRVVTLFTVGDGVRNHFLGILTKLSSMQKWKDAVVGCQVKSWKTFGDWLLLCYLVNIFFHSIFASCTLKHQFGTWRYFGTQPRATMTLIKLLGFVGNIGVAVITEKGSKSAFKITSTLTFAAACASAGITVLIGNDLNNCALNHCTRFMTATAMAFMSWFAVSPSFLLNFWSLASR